MLVKLNLRLATSQEPAHNPRVALRGHLPRPCMALNAAPVKTSIDKRLPNPPFALFTSPDNIFTVMMAHRTVPYPPLRLPRVNSIPVHPPRTIGPGDLIPTVRNLTEGVCTFTTVGLLYVLLAHDNPGMSKGEVYMQDTLPEGLYQDLSAYLVRQPEEGATSRGGCGIVSQQFIGA